MFLFFGVHKSRNGALLSARELIVVN